MNWSDNHPSNQLTTSRLAAFRAFRPNLEATNNEVHASLRPNALQAWAYAPDFVAELQKSYPECDFDNTNNPSKVIFRGESGRNFFSDFEEEQGKSARRNAIAPTIIPCLVAI